MLMLEKVPNFMIEDDEDPIELNDIFITFEDDEPICNPNPTISRNIPYYPAGSKALLKSACEYNEVLVAGDCGEKGAKFYKIVNAEKWLQTTQRSDSHEYECLRGTVYPYIDIETENTSVDAVAMLDSVLHTFTVALREEGFDVEGIALADSSRTGKISFHAIIHTYQVFENTKYLNHFIQTKIRPSLTEYADCVDWGVYTTDRVIRFLNQSKKGKKVQLKAYTHPTLETFYNLYQNPSDFLIGQYSAIQKKIHSISIPEQVVPLKEIRESSVSVPVCDASYLSELCTLVPITQLATNTDRCKFIWAMTNSGASEAHIIQFALQDKPEGATPHNIEWVRSKIAQASTYTVTLGSIHYWASKTAGYTAFCKKWLKNDLSKEIHTLETVIQKETYSERYVRPLDWSTTDTLLLKSHLGTGKTTQLVASLKPISRFLQTAIIPFNRILIVSGRKSFTAFICGDLQSAELGFKSYEEKCFGELSSVNRLVCQAESLWRLSDGFEKYDLVVMDECETVLHQFYSESTHRNNMIRNHEMLERCIASATKVLFADAFLGTRTVQLSTSLRNISHSKLIENTFCPYSRRAIRLTDDKKQPALGEFCSRIMKSLHAGEKVAVVWGSLNKAKAFCESYLSKSTFKWRLYSSESPPDERAELSNVSTVWSGLDILCYTSSITVGINYDSVEKPFNALFLYASASGGLPRDIAQSLLRCRKITSETLVYTVDTKCLSRALFGRDRIKEFIKDKTRTITGAHPVLHWTSAPKWAEDNWIENENENGSKCIAFSEILDEYLVKSGYTLSSEIIQNDTLKLACEKVYFHDIQDISSDEAEHLRIVSKRGLATLEEKQSLTKFSFCSQFKVRDEDVLAPIWDELIADNKEHVFWNQVKEKHQTTAEQLKYESEHRYILNSSKKCLKRIVLDKVLPLLGIKHTAEPFTCTVSTELAEQLKTMETEIYDAFQSSGHGKRGKKEFGTSTATDMLKMIFLSWNGVGLNCESKRKMTKGVRVNTFVVSNKPNALWDLITDKDVSVAD